jgi:hypothetical protein
MSAILMFLVGLLLELTVVLMVMRWTRRQRRRRAIASRLALLQNGLL